MKGSDESIVLLADAMTRRRPPERLAWDWGEGLFLYALARLSFERYQGYLEAYFAAHERRGLPDIDWSDKCAPGLAALELHERTGNAAAGFAARRVANYVRSAPAAAGGINHFGRAWMSRLYPSSLWVDSLMMVNVFAARFGRARDDAELTALAARLPFAFARVLVDPKSRLFAHAYFVALRRRVPRGAHWLRGNGWALASLAATIEALDARHPDAPALRALLRTTALAIVPHQREDGFFGTLIDRHDTYPESSGTALVACGLFDGVRLGVLSTDLLQPAERAMRALVASLESTEGGASMPGISGPTMPYPALVYRMIPRFRDLPFGVAAFILAACARRG